MEQSRNSTFYFLGLPGLSLSRTTAELRTVRMFDYLELHVPRLKTYSPRKVSTGHDEKPRTELRLLKLSLYTYN